MTTAAHTCDTRRDSARRLADEGKSLRAIAAELGVSKDTVRRDLGRGDADASPVDATGATQARTVLPGAHPSAVEAVEVLRDIDAEALRDDVRQACDTRPYLLATGRRVAELLADMGPLDPLDRLSLRHLADWLRDLADGD